MIILKPRQKGASTCAQALTYHHMRKHENLSGSLMGDISGTSDKVFEIYRRYAENDMFPWDESGGSIADGGSLADLIKLQSKSNYGKETAGSKNAGRSGTIQVGNMTEVAFWPMQEKETPHLDIFNHYTMAIMFLWLLLIPDTQWSGRLVLSHMGSGQ